MLDAMGPAGFKYHDLLQEKPKPSEGTLVLWLQFPRSLPDSHNGKPGTSGPRGETWRTSGP